MYKNIQPKVLEKNSNSHINSWLFIKCRRKINHLKFSICNLHCCKLVNIHARERMCFIFICDPIILKICHASKPITHNIASCFFHHYREHLMSLTSTWTFWIAKSLEWCAPLLIQYWNPPFKRCPSYTLHLYP